MFTKLYVDSAQSIQVCFCSVLKVNIILLKSQSWHPFKRYSAQISEVGTPFKRYSAQITELAPRLSVILKRGRHVSYVS